MWQKLGKCYPPQLELVALLLLFLTFNLTFSAFPSLPDRIPTHFDLQGIPDGWGSRQELIIFPFLGAFIYILLTVIGILMATAKDPRKYINLPRNRKAALNDSQLESLRIILVRGLFALKLLTQSLVLYLLYVTVAVARGSTSRLGDYWLFFPVAILIVVLYMVGKSFGITRNP